MSKLTPTKTCSRCGAVCLSNGFTTGYGIDTRTDRVYCYPCMAVRDANAMLETGKAVLYLVAQSGNAPYKLTNWPGTLEIPVYMHKRGRHNIAGTRHDVWFLFRGQEWHGVQYGENSQVAHCRRKAT